MRNRYELDGLKGQGVISFVMLHVPMPMGVYLAGTISEGAVSVA